MSKCTISIIIPAYNVEKYLNEALDSISAQVEFPDEVILIDDGSTDKTLPIAYSYSFPFSYQVISIENGGQGNARNIGTRLASSEYIYYFDSDDILDENFIKKIKTEIIKNNIPDIILFSGQTFNDKEYIGKRWIEYSRGFSGHFQSRIDFLDTALENNGLFCSPCLYVSKKSLWDKNGIKFGSNYLEDEAIFFPLLFSCNDYCVLDEVFFYRRNRDGSTMTIQPNLKHVIGALNCIEVTMSLYCSKVYLRRECWHINKRLGGQIVSYVYMAKAAREKISYHKLFNALLAAKSFSIAIKCFLYFIGLHEVKSVRGIIRFGRKILMPKNN